MTILIIDDEQALRETLREMLETLDYDVCEAKDGSQGLEILRSGRNIGLVITDILMPEKDGIETIHDIRRLYAQLPIIAMSGGGVTRNMSFLEYARKLGATRVLHKPIKFKDLTDAVASVAPLRNRSVPYLFGI